MSTKDINTPYGVIHVSDPGPYQKYDNIRTYKQNKTGTRLVILQGPALRAFKAAEERCKTRRRPTIHITGVGYRSYDLQHQLWSSDPGRFANPNSSMHVEGLAVDVDQSVGTLRLRAIHKALRAEGWNQSVAGEPWHYSYHVSG